MSNNKRKDFVMCYELAPATSKFAKNQLKERPNRKPIKYITGFQEAIQMITIYMGGTFGEVSFPVEQGKGINMFKLRFSRKSNDGTSSTELRKPKVTIH